jgi:hypothetical protein
MVRLILSLPWELLGPRPAMVSFTYPGDWRLWVPDGRVWDGHRRAMERRWVRQWGEPLVGVWAKEFQRRGAPHLHWYVGLPTSMAQADFEGLQARTRLVWRLQQQHGKFRGRAMAPVIGGDYGGEFGWWLRTAWAKVVGTDGVVKAHHGRGVDVKVFFVTEQAAKKDRTEVALYLAGEAAKLTQKEPPDFFVGVGRYYGYWGRQAGFEPVVEDLVLPPAVGREVERRLARWVSVKLGKRRGAFDERRQGDGVTARGLGPVDAARVLRWSQAAADRKAQRAAQRREEWERSTADLAELWEAG